MDVPVIFYLFEIADDKKVKGDSEKKFHCELDLRVFLKCGKQVTRQPLEQDY